MHPFQEYVYFKVVAEDKEKNKSGSSNVVGAPNPTYKESKGWPLGAK
jgi:hypothetical protein